MSAQRVEGLIVDFGGVLTTNIWEAFDQFCEREGLESGTVLAMFRDNSDALAMLRRLERGEIADADFERQFAALLGPEVEPEGVIERLFAGLDPEKEMIAAVRRAKQAGIPTGLITNSWGTGIYDRAPLEIFDGVVISGDVGLHKPEPEIYRLGAERIGLSPEQCAFVDDLRENVEGAEAVGMTGIRHRNPAETIAELEQLLGVQLSP